MSVQKARELLENQKLLSPASVKKFAHAISTCLFQIADLKTNDLNNQTRNLIRAAAILLEESGYDKICNATKEIVLEQLKDISEDITLITEGMKTDIKTKFKK